MPDGGNLTPDVRAAILATAQAMATELARRSSQDRLDALPLEVFAEQHDIPLSTLDAARRKDQGPAIFTIGRRVYCLRVEWNAWLHRLAQTGGTGPLNSPRKPQDD